MRINLYFLSGVLLSCMVLSCSKGSPVDNPAFGGLLFSPVSAEKIDVVAGDDQKPLQLMNKVNLISGKNRFRFYISEDLVLDTMLNVKPFVVTDYYIFKPGDRDQLKIMDRQFNGLENEYLPDSGSVKLSIANLNYALPDKVNIVLSTTTFVNGIGREIQVGEFPNVSRSFSSFRKVLIGKAQLAGSTELIKITVKDVNQNVIGTSSLTFPLGPGNLLTNGVFLIYIGVNNASSILMSK
jgi:hypothetical protein